MRINSAVGGTGAISNTATVTVTPANDGLVLVNTILNVLSADGVLVGPDNTRLYGANYNEGTISMIDQTGRAGTTTAPTGDFPEQLALSPDGTRVYVSS